ncbi:MAG: carbohydrate ABC transporter permease, partial [Caballeronia sp.]
MSHPASTTSSMQFMDMFKRGILGVIAWLMAILLFFPIFWMTITAFKTEQQAY